MERYTTSRLSIVLDTTKNIYQAIDFKPDDEAEWKNISQKIYNCRQALACIICGGFSLDSYTPVNVHCHCLCASCKNQGHQNRPYRQNCPTCREALETQDGFEKDKSLWYATVAVRNLSKYILGRTKKWSELPINTQNGPITFGQLCQEISDAGSENDPSSDLSLGEKFCKKVKEKEHHCRCGSGAKKGKEPGNITCLGQRCACYKSQKTCQSCKCIGCKNPFGTS